MIAASAPDRRPSTQTLSIGRDRWLAIRSEGNDWLLAVFERCPSGYRTLCPPATTSSCLYAQDWDQLEAGGIRIAKAGAIVVVEVLGVRIGHVSAQALRDRAWDTMED